MAQRGVRLIQPLNPPELKFQVTEEGAAYLRRFSGPLHVVSVVGKMRQGKSYILCLLAGQPQVFELGHTVRSCTEGIDVFVVPHASGTGHLVLLDVEGQGSPQRNETYDAALTTIAMLLSSLVVYNCLSVGTGEDVQRLVLLSGFMQNVIDKSAEDHNEREGARTDRFFPALLWLLRDFYLQLVDATGKDCDADTYLEQVLLAPAVPAATKAAKDRNRMLIDVKSVLQQRCLRTLPRPVAAEQDFQLVDEQGVDSEVVRPEFKRQVEAVIRDIQEMVGIKQFGGGELNGASFAALAKHLAKTVDANGVPEVTSAWQQVCKDEATKAFEAARKTFLDRMDAELSRRRRKRPHQMRSGVPLPAGGMVPVPEEALQQSADAAAAAASDTYFATAFVANEEEVRQLSASLNEWRAEQVRANEATAMAFCKELIQAVYCPVGSGVESGLFTGAGGFARYCEDLNSAMLEYQECCQGCVPEHISLEILKVFSDEKENERNILRVNDENLSEAQRQAQVQAEQMQRERIEHQRERAEQAAELKRQADSHQAQLRTMEEASERMRLQMQAQQEEDARMQERREAQMQEFLRQNQEEGRSQMQAMMEVSAQQSKAQQDQMSTFTKYMEEQQQTTQQMMTTVVSSLSQINSQPPVIIESGPGCCIV